jgi:hypothetical protein
MKTVCNISLLVTGLVSLTAGAMIFSAVSGHRIGHWLPVIWAFITCLYFANGVVGLAALFLRPKAWIIFVQVAVACLIFLPLSLLVIPLGKFLWGRQFAAVQAYADRISPRLESFKQAHGHYPDSLDELSDIPKVPNGVGYWVDDPGTPSEGFSLSYPEEWGFFDACEEYSSKTRQWEETDEGDSPP